MSYTYSITNEMVQNVYGLFISNTGDGVEG